MKRDVRFLVTTPAGTVPRGKRVILNLELENAGEAPVYVNARFAVVPRVGDVWLALRRGAAEVPFRLRVRLRPLLASDFVLLQPGERVIAGYDLGRGYKLDDPGVYSISAEYVSEDVPKELAQQDVWKGRATAPEQQLTIG